MSASPTVDHTNLFLAISALIIMIIFLLAALRFSQFKVRQKTRELRQAIDDVNARIEQLKHYEKTLFAQKEQYRAVTETSKEMILRFDSNCSVIFANQCAVSTFGLGGQDGIFHLRLIDNQLDENFIRSIERAIAKIFESRLSDELELEFNAKEGKKPRNHYES